MLNIFPASRHINVSRIISLPSFLSFFLPFSRFVHVSSSHRRKTKSFARQKHFSYKRSARTATQEQCRGEFWKVNKSVKRKKWNYSKTEAETLVDYSRTSLVVWRKETEFLRSFKRVWESRRKVIKFYWTLRRNFRVLRWLFVAVLRLFVLFVLRVRHSTDQFTTSDHRSSL